MNMNEIRAPLYENMTVTTAEDFGGLSSSFRIKWAVSKEDFERVKCISNRNCPEECKTRNLTKETFAGYKLKRRYDSKELSGDSKFKNSSNNTTLDKYFENTQNVRSKLYNLAPVENLSFYLKLGFNNGRYIVTVELNSEDFHDSIEMQYAFVIVNSRVYYVADPKSSVTLQNIQYRFLTEDVVLKCKNVAVPKRSLDICAMIIVYSDVLTPAHGADQMNSSKLNVFIPRIPELHNIPGQRSFFTSVRENLSFRNEIWKYQNGGKLPLLDIDKAMLLLVHSNVMKDSVLKVLAMEYLVHSLDKNTVLDLLSFSIDSKTVHLKNACFDFLLDKCKIVKLISKDTSIII